MQQRLYRCVFAPNIFLEEGQGREGGVEGLLRRKKHPVLKAMQTRVRSVSHYAYDKYAHLFSVSQGIDGVTMEVHGRPRPGTAQVKL